jgi:hypothetical protein
LKNTLSQLNDQQQSVYSTSATFIPSESDELIETNLSEEDDSLPTLSTQLPSNSVPLNKPNEIQIKRQDKPFTDFIDENGRVRPYVDFAELDRRLALDQHKSQIDEFIRKLESLVVAPEAIPEQDETTKL